jgi:hypothetical protein
VKRFAILAGLMWRAVAAAQPGDFIVDFGHSAPGHGYDYVAHYRNNDTAAVTVAKDPSGCASCPNLRLRYDPVAPGDSLPLHFRLTLDPETADSVVIEMPVIVRHSSGPELISYALRIDGSPPRIVSPAAAVAVTAAGDGMLEGRLDLANSGRGRIRVRCVGMPAGLRFRDKQPVAVKGGARAAIRFSCRPEDLLEHRSLTFQVTDDGGAVIERFSLPVEAK